MNFSKRFLSIATVFIVVGVLGGGIYLRLRPEPAEARDAGASATGDPEDLPEVSSSQQFATNVPQPVTGADVLRDTLWIRVTAAGQAEAYRRATLTNRVEGLVTSVPVRENQAVGSGRRVLQIDTTEYALAVARARSDLLNAEADFRQLILFDDEIEDPEVRAERARLARARSGLAQAEVGVREAEMNLARTRITAPFPGRIADLDLVPGQFVSAGTELMTIVDLDPIKVEVQVLEAEIGYLKEGRRAEVSFAAFPDEVFVGRVETLNPLVDPETRTARVTVLLSNPTGRIKPGMYARVVLDAESFEDRVMVPRTAILERDRRTMLFVYEGDRRQGLAKWRYVTTGLENDEYVEIVDDPETSMVEAGEVVLVDGHHYLVHDATVRLVANPAAAGGRPSR